MSFFSECLAEMTDIEDDVKEMNEEEKPSIFYGSYLNDCILTRWDEVDNPNELLTDPQFKDAFEKIFTEHKTEIGRTLYRGTDYSPLTTLKVGDDMDYGKRYTSWSYERNDAEKFCDENEPTILLILNTSLMGLDLSEDIGQTDLTVVLAPVKFKVQHCEKGKTQIIFTLVDA